MTEAQCVEVIEHAARMLRMAGKPKEALVLQARGYTYKAIAGEMRATQATVRKYASRGWRAIAGRVWQDWELQQLQAVANKILDTTQTLEEHARDLQEAAKNSRRVTPRPMDYDDLGRPVAGRDNQVSVDDIIRLLLGWNGMRRLF